MFNVDPGLSVILASIIAILGYWIQAYFSRKMEVEKETRREKTKRFTIIISELPYVFFPAYKEKLTKEELVMHAEKFFGAYRDLWLYAGDEVILSFNDLIDLFMKPSVSEVMKSEANLKLAKTLLAIRKDLGIKTSLTEKDFRFFVIS
jgi:hypothetical protein